MNFITVLLVIGQTGAAGDLPPASSSSFGAPPGSSPAVVSDQDSPIPSVLPGGGGFLPTGNAEPGGLGRRSSADFGVPAAQVDSARPSAAIRSLGSEAPARGLAPQSLSGQTAQANNPPSASLGGPATATVSASAAPSQELQQAADLVGSILALDEQTAPKVRRVRLVEVLARGGDPAAQAAIIGAYWDLTHAIARARYTAGNVEYLLSSIPEPNQEPDRSLYEVAVTKAESDDESAQERLLAAQFRLMRASAMAWDGLLPWPADLPLVSAYRTNFDMYFAQRPASIEVRQLHHTLPHKLRLIERRVVAVAAAERASDVIVGQYRQGAAPLTLVLEVVASQEQARRDFVDAIIDYNNRIAEYSLATVGMGLAPETLVSTLIRTSSPTSAMVAVPRDVRSAAAVAPTLPEGVLYGR